MTESSNNNVSVEEIVNTIGSMSSDNIAKLGKALSERWGVSAVAPVAAPAAAPSDAAQTTSDSKSELDILIKGCKSGKMLEALKAVRSNFTDVGSVIEVREKLNAAKPDDPYVVATGIPADKAKAMAKVLDEAGAIVDVE